MTRVTGERPRSLTLLALFLATGLLAFTYAALTVHRRTDAQLAANPDAHRAVRELHHWLHHGYFASYGLIPPTEDPNVLYRVSPGGYRITGYLFGLAARAFTGRYEAQWIAFHNEVFSLVLAVLFALLAYRLAWRLDAEPLHALAFAIGAQMVLFTFPESLALYWDVTAQAAWLMAVIAFLLLEESPYRHPILLALTVFAMVYAEVILGTLFIAAYVIIVLLLRDERPPLERLVLRFAVPWLAAFAVFGTQLMLAKYEPAVKLIGSGFLYRTGLDGDAMFYGTPLDIAFGRDVIRNGRPGNPRFCFHWPVLFLAGVLAVIATLVAYVRRRVPRLALIAVAAPLGAYLLYAGVFSQAVALHPYLYDLVLAPALILALFAIVPALVEAHTRTGTIAFVTFFIAAWLSFYQLRMYALCYPP
jgi:hypothetical protein